MVKGFLKLLSLLMLIKQSILNKDKAAVPPLFNSPGVFSFASDKTKLFAETLYENSNLDDSYIF